MRLKEYQVRALEALSRYLALLSDATDKAEKARAAIAALPEDLRASLAAAPDPVAPAWDEARKQKIAAAPHPWRELKDGLGRSIPHVCLKLPTGGGKTLLAAHGLDRILVSHFRQTAGLVLWIVPSEAIYAQTKAQLSDRGHAIRQALDRASGGRVKIFEKLDGFTRQDVEQRLCILLLMLQSTGRKDKESLKVFRDSGHYMSFFPADDDAAARAKLLQAVPNLETFDIAEGALGGEAAGRIKQSLGNTLRLVRPIIVLDEGHRAYSALARGTLASLNPRFLLELSATPDATQSNILVSVNGRALKDEEMIKLPIQLDVISNANWQTTLRRALDRLDELEKAARDFEAERGRYIRPIMLVRVDRTGREQREKKGDFVHAEDAFEYLTQKAGIPPDAIRRQTAETKELKDDDLLSPYCPVRAIITKDALREGWDCPFAYVLAILSKGTAKTALTQMIGRVLRQPHAARTGVDALDQTHVFCAEVEVRTAVERIKDGLEAEGMGDLGGDIVTSGKAAAEGDEVTVRFRPPFRGQRIMVPRVLHREGKKAYRELDYEADILALVDFEALSYRKANEFLLADYDVAQRRTVTLDLDGAAALGDTSTDAPVTVIEQSLDRPALIRRMLDVVPNPWQAQRILDEALDALRQRGAEEAKIVRSRLTLVDSINEDLRDQVNAAAEEVFRAKVKSGDIVFKLLATPFDRLNAEFREVFKTHVAFGDARQQLFHGSGDALERALYDKVFKKDFNGFEADVALYLDSKVAVTWWWRIASRGHWSVQGWLRNKVYPDFLVHVDTDGETARLLALETKGKHLEGSEDTTFKGKLFELLEEAYTMGRDAGEVELYSEAPESMRFRIMVEEEDWKFEIEKALR